MTVPAVVRYAGYLVAVQGIAGLVVAVVYLGHTLTGANQDQVRGLALGGFGYGAVRSRPSASSPGWPQLP